jgi:hypothetical protein
MEMYAHAGQCLLDIAIQVFGDEQRVFELAALNDLSLTHQFVNNALVVLPTLTAQPRSVAILDAYRVKVQRLNEPVVDIDGWLIDENGDPLVDENGNILVASVPFVLIP